MTQTKSSLQFILIGCGKIGQRHAALIAQRGILLAVCDSNRARANALALQYNAIPYEDIDTLIESGLRADVGVVCTPNGLHASHSIKFLRAGMHVLCEKPMSISASDCIDMINTAANAGKHLLVVKQNRFNPPVVAVKQALDSGRLGRVQSLQVNGFWNRNADYYKDDWHGTRKLDGGTLFTQFSHFIDLMYWFTGEVDSSAALFANYQHKDIIEFEDTGHVLLSFMNGASGTFNYTVNSHRKNMEGSLTLFAEKGTVKIGGEYLNKLEYASVTDYEFGVLDESNNANDYGAYKGSMNNHDKVYDNLLDVVLNNAAASVSAMEGMKTVEIIERIYQGAVIL